MRARSRRSAPERLVAPAHRAARRRHQRRQDPQQRRLARAVGTEHRRHPAGLEACAHAVQRAPAPVDLADRPEDERASCRARLVQRGEVLVNLFQPRDELARADRRAPACPRRARPAPAPPAPRTATRACRPGASVPRRPSAAPLLAARGPSPAGARTRSRRATSSQRERRPRTSRPPESVDGSPLSVNFSAPPCGDRVGTDMTQYLWPPSTRSSRAPDPGAADGQAGDLLLGDQRQRRRCRSAPAVRTRACRHGRAARSRTPLRWPCARRRRRPSCERWGTIGPCTAMPWFWRTSTLRSFSCDLRAHEAAGQRDLERARHRVEHLVGGVLERQELEDLQRVLAHLHDDPAAAADGDRRRIARCAPAPGSRRARRRFPASRTAPCPGAARASRSPPRSRSGVPGGQVGEARHAGGVALARCATRSRRLPRPCRAMIGWLAIGAAALVEQADLQRPRRQRGVRLRRCPRWRPARTCAARRRAGRRRPAPRTFRRRPARRRPDAQINMVRMPPIGGIVNVSVFSFSPSTVTSAVNSSPGAMPSNSARPLVVGLGGALAQSPPAFLMMALTSTFATAFAGILRATRTLDRAGRHPAVGQRLARRSATGPACRRRRRRPSSAGRRAAGAPAARRQRRRGALRAFRRMTCRTCASGSLAVWQAGQLGRASTPARRRGVAAVAGAPRRVRAPAAPAAASALVSINPR